MRFFDLHCDTLYRAITENKTLNQSEFHVSIDKARQFDKYIGCFAAWIPDDYKGIAAFELFNSMYSKLKSSCDNEFQRCTDKKSLSDLSQGAIFTVENGAALGGNISNLDYLYNCGVRAMTLTWNDSNELGDGIGVSRPKGITEFGRNVVNVMEERGIAVDVSHASEHLFYDVASMSSRPFIATHSNARRICSHKRNLTDEQIRMINSVHGIIGVNFCDYFLKDDGNASIVDIFKHIEYFLSMGCEDSLCIGSDFDGSDMPSCISGIESVGKIYDYCLQHNYSEGVVDKIFFSNAYNFFKQLL